MKSKYLILMILFLVGATAGCAYAMTAPIGNDLTFEAPEHYTVMQQGANFSYLENDSTHAVRVCEADNCPSENQLVGTYQAAFTVKDHDTIKENGTEIAYVHFIDGDDQIYTYVWKFNDYNIMAVYGYPNTEPATEWADSPVKMIHDTMVEL